MEIENIKRKIIERSKCLGAARGAEERIESFVREALGDIDLCDYQIELLLTALNLHPIKSGE